MRYIVPWRRDALSRGEDPVSFSFLQREMNRLLEDFVGPAELHLDQSVSKNFVPKINVSEDKEKFEVDAELPGLDEKDVDVTVENGILSLKGEKKIETESKDKNYHRIERSSGSFLRQFTLPENIESDKIQAHFSKGVLKVIVPKAREPKAQAKKIEIKSA